MLRMRRACPASAASVQSACAASSALAHMAGSRTWLPGWKEMPATSRPRKRPRSIRRSASRREQPNLRLSGQSASDASTSMRMIDPRAGGVRGDLPELLLGVGGELLHAHGVGMGDVGGALDGVAEGDAVGGDAEAEAEVDLAARGAVEAPAQLGQRRHDLGRGVRLDRVVDRGVAEAGRRARGTCARSISRSKITVGRSKSRERMKASCRAETALIAGWMSKSRAGSPAKAAACRMRISISPGLVPEFPKETLPSLREFSRKGTLQRRVRWRQERHMRPRACRNQAETSPWGDILRRRDRSAGIPLKHR